MPTPSSGIGEIPARVSARALDLDEKFVLDCVRLGLVKGRVQPGKTARYFVVHEDLITFLDDNRKRVGK